MQGRCTEGRALKALEGRKHLSMVTYFRQKWQRDSSSECGVLVT